MGRKSILLIIPWLPYPLKSGGHQALFNGIKVIKDNFDIYVAFEVFDDEKYMEEEKNFLEIIPNVHLLPFFKKRSISLPKYPLWYRSISNLKTKILDWILKGNEVSEIKSCNEILMCSDWVGCVSPLSKSWIEHVSRICKKHQFDIIQVEMPWLISQILTLPNGPTKIFVHHELGFVKRELEKAQFPESEYVKACKLYADFVEIGLLNMYDAVITLSSVDKQKLIEHGVKIPVFDSFAIVDNSKGLVSEEVDGTHLSFVGGGGHSPNVAGISWFLDNCWTLLKAKNNNYRLSIIGEWDDEMVAKYMSKYPGVEFLGFVDKLAEHLKGTVMIVPITIGSGIRMKVLEACSLGVPFISTSIGVEGIPVVDGENCFIADTIDQFVDKLFRLNDSCIQKKFVKNAHAMVKRLYSEVALHENRMGIYENLLRNDRSSGFCFSSPSANGNPVHGGQ